MKTCFVNVFTIMKKFFVNEKSAPLSDTHPLNIETEAGGRPMFTWDIDSDIDYKRIGERHLSEDEIKEKLEGYIPLHTMEDKKILASLPYYETRVRYINNYPKKFESGYLIDVKYPHYIMLSNTKMTYQWSVELNDKTIFIRKKKKIQN